MEVVIVTFYKSVCSAAVDAGCFPSKKSSILSLGVIHPSRFLCDRTDPGNYWSFSIHRKRVRVLEGIMEVDYPDNTSQDEATRDVSDGELSVSENRGWADAMSKVLHSQPKTGKRLMLAKSKRDSGMKKRKIKKRKSEAEIEIVGATGKVLKDDINDANASHLSSKRQKRKEMVESQEKEGKLEVDDPDGEATEDGELSVSENRGWADAMSKVLHSQPKTGKQVILAEAKRDSGIKKRKIKKRKAEIEIVGARGKILKDDSNDAKASHLSSKKQRRKEMIERRKKREAWENMCRSMPDEQDEEKERELMRIATRGVVQLFNAVLKHQKNKDEKIQTTISKEESLRKERGAKGNFLDILKTAMAKSESSTDVSSFPCM